MLPAPLAQLSGDPGRTVGGSPPYPLPFSMSLFQPQLQGSPDPVGGSSEVLPTLVHDMQTDFLLNRAVMLLGGLWLSAGERRWLILHPSAAWHIAVGGLTQSHTTLSLLAVA